MHDGWNLIQELNVPTSGDPTVLRQYTWGLDLSGQNGDASVSGLHGAGGIGGLLAVLDTNNTATTSDDRSYAYLYDANGNVGQLVEWATDAGGASGTAWATARMAARYEYDPYGNTISKSGSYADTNPFCFSTKFLDAETGLYYYGYRYYSPRLGRWISRDPMEERGGRNLFAFSNDPLSGFDPLGEQAETPAGGSCKTAMDCEARFGSCPPPSHYEVHNGQCVCASHTPRNWGNCEDCDKVCTGGDGHPYGRTTCENGKPCYCVCGTRIQSYRGNSEYGAGIVEQCTERHEHQHARTKQCGTPRTESDECNADAETLRCLQEKAVHCDELPRAQRDACYRVLISHIKNASHCRANKGEPPCSAQSEKACRDAKEKVLNDLRKRQRSGP